MIILPAIDIKNGKVVRLKQGDFNQETVYSNNPLEIAKQFEKAKAKWLHIVDLDGASQEKNRNIEIIKEIRENTSLSIQTGGGIRTEEDVKRLIDIGIDRVIIGTLAVKNPELLNKIVNKFGSEKILISIDPRDGKVATSGWKEESEVKVIDFAKKLEQMGIKYILYTDIKRDGMLSGPDIKGLKELKENTSLKIIASGGISSLKDIEKLNELNFYGVITGQALYTNQFNLKEAIEKVGG
jgi:phosphoribosylformimino-5-aminoimidazole carboxamide ribotide isomerase